MEDLRNFTFALWLWMAGVLFVASLSAWLGANMAALAGAAALALSGAVVGFVLAPRLHEAWARGGFLLAWLVIGVGLSASAGGAWSPLMILLVLPAAWAAALRSSDCIETTAICILAVPVSAWIGVQTGPADGLGMFPDLMAIVAIAFAGGLFALERAQADAAEARQRIEAGHALAEAAHELRTPLNHIVGFADAMEQQVFGPLSERYTGYARLIRQSGRRLVDLVGDVLDVSRLSGGRLGLSYTRFDFAALVKELVAEFEADAKAASLELTVNAHAPLNVSADAHAMRRVLTNLLANALKFTPEGGKVAVSLVRQGENVVLEVADSGPGIPETERARLTQPFERGAEAAGVEGAGLGLSYVRALTAAHGGHLEISSGPLGGALLRVIAPIAIATN